MALSFFLAAACASAQVSVQRQTDVALSIYGAFTNTTGKNSVTQIQDSPSNSIGGMVDLRHIHSPFVGYEAAYSFNSADQVYIYTGPTPAGAGNEPPTITSAYAQEATGDWVFSYHPAKVRPFALAGVGILLNEPTGGQSNTQSYNTAVYVYGAGLDWQLLPRLGVRFQYRGNIHKAPYLILDFGSSDLFTHTAEPTIGVYYKF